MTVSDLDGVNASFAQISSATNTIDLDDARWDLKEMN